MHSRPKAFGHDPTQTEAKQSNSLVKNRMKNFFKVQELEHVLEFKASFPRVGSERIPLSDSLDRIVSTDIIADTNLPEFSRSTMDGYAVCASSTFGASEGNPAYLIVKGSISMGETPAFSICPGDAAAISTGGMLPEGADSVIMIEHTGIIDDKTIEAYHSIAPGHNIIKPGEDICKGEILLTSGRRVRPQELGFLAAFGCLTIDVYKKPMIGIISTGDEIVPIDKNPGSGNIRDINTYSLSGLVKKYGGIPVSFGIVRDNLQALFKKASLAVSATDMVLISGGSSVGIRDFTIDVLSSMPDSTILTHGISISPGKPTILAKTGNKAFWGMPGQTVSAMVVFEAVVRPFIEHIAGLLQNEIFLYVIYAILARNIASAQGRTDYIRVRLIENNGVVQAEPILGKSNLISTMVKANGLVKIETNSEGLEKGATVPVIII